mmetsp:Transcript_55751/g.155397  ORF Transcript_55751/g.155397 Transcript_55751/m.155397 type:complete len:229 (-) Transcript_55751:207-893(-)
MPPGDGQLAHHGGAVGTCQPDGLAPVPEVVPPLVGLARRARLLAGIRRWQLRRARLFRIASHRLAPTVLDRRQVVAAILARHGTGSRSPFHVREGGRGVDRLHVVRVAYAALVARARADAAGERPIPLRAPLTLGITPADVQILVTPAMPAMACLAAAAVLALHVSIFCPTELQKADLRAVCAGGRHGVLGVEPREGVRAPRHLHLKALIAIGAGSRVHYCEAVHINA